MRKSMKGIVALLLTCLMTAGFFVGCSGVTDGNYPVNDKYVKLLGRTYSDADYEDTLWFSYSASGIEFAYENCTSCTIDLVGDTMAGQKTEKSHHPRYAILVNDEVVKEDLLSTVKETVEVPLSSNSGTVRVVKLSETSDSSMGIGGIHVDGKIKPTEQEDIKIEFIGDSITCGYGVDGVLGDTYSTANENATKTYAYLTAQNMDADYSMVSMSGYGVYSGYTTGTTANTDQTIPQYYTKLGNSYGKLLSGVNPNELEWNFADFVPDYIVINLGTNDASFCKTNEEKENFVAAYVDFLKEIRANNKNATIVCTLGIMGNDMFLSIEEAVGKYQSETGDDKVTFFEFSQQTGDYAVDYHPTAASHEKAAEELTQFLRSLAK